MEKRLNKFISDAGFCSRREADKLIEEERVTVNGKLPAPGTKVTAKDKVRIDDQLLQVREEEPVFLVFNKPANMSANADPGVRDNVVRAINYPASILPIGHLEREAEGLLFLSNNSELVRKMTRADNRYEKEYIVTVDKLLAPDFIQKLSSGGAEEAGEAKKKNHISKEGSARFRIILQPGTNHNIRRMCESLGYRVVHLERVRINNITLAKLATGFWRQLTAQEVEELVQVAIAGKGTLNGQLEKRNTYQKAFSAAGGHSKGRSASAKPDRSGAAGKGRPENTTSKRNNTAKSSSGAAGRKTSASEGFKDSSGRGRKPGGATPGKRTPAGRSGSKSSTPRGNSGKQR
ncbi:pseudouridine synthase [Pontibacter chitinilyticus]|uniref:pseudouridine synthase n=1 Tax=Pontibacter chitinilyticus TaxID=2674989 RepID=UPI00321A255C